MSRNVASEEHGIITKNMENKALVSYLDNYISEESPNFAVLIDGKWGSGKTYFIKNYYLERAHPKTKNPIKDTSLYVSLSGCSSVKDLEERTFKALIQLGSGEPSELSIVAFEYFSKLGIESILDSKSDPNLVNLLSRFWQWATCKTKKKAFDIRIKKIDVVIFDDFERVENLPMRKLVGFLNQYIEHDNKKVILVADTSEISKPKSFRKFKEKIIGQELAFTQDLDYIIELHLDEYGLNDDSSLAPTIRSSIHNVMRSCDDENINLRTLSRIFYDIKSIKTHLDLGSLNIEYLFEHIFTLRLHLNSGEFGVDDLRKLSNYKYRTSFTVDADDTSENDNDNDSELLSKLFKEKLKIFFDKESFLFFHHFFKHGTLPDGSNVIEKYYSHQSEPSWVKLWHVWDFSSEETLIEEFNLLWIAVKLGDFDTAGDLLQIFGISRKLLKSGLIQINDFKEDAEAAINTLSDQQIEEFVARRSMLSDAYGRYGIHESDSEEYKEFEKAVSRKIKKHKVEQLHLFLKLALENVSESDMTPLENLSRKHRNKLNSFWWGNSLVEDPILDENFAEGLFNVVKNYTPSKLSDLMSILEERYRYFSPDSPFIEGEKQFLVKLNSLFIDQFLNEGVVNNLRFEFVQKDLKKIIDKLMTQEAK